MGGRVSLRQHPKTRIFSADIRDRHANRIHVSLRTTRRTEAETRMVAVRELIREGDDQLIADLRARRINIEALARCYRDRRPFSELRPAPAWPTLAAASKQYLRWIEHHPRRSAGTLQQARMLMRQAVAFFGASSPVNTITPERVTEYRAHLEGQGLAANTVRAKLDRVGAFYHWLEKQEAGASRTAGRAPKPLFSPVDPEMIPAKGEPRVRFLTGEEPALVAAATPRSWQAFVGLGLLGGLRVGEARNLRVQDVDLEHQLVHITAHEDWTPKSKDSARSVPVATSLLPLLAERVAAVGASGWLFPNAGGTGPVSDEVVAAMLERVVTAAGLVYGAKEPNGVTYHTLRHSFAANLVMAGVDLFTVARLLGHATTAKVEDTYGHLSPEHRRMAIDKLGERFAGVVFAETT
jgi:integrase